MRVWTGDPRMWGPGPDRGTVLTVGVFDGVHRGHQSILAGLSNRARQSGGLEKVVVTFDVHPRSLVTPGHAPKMLTTVAHRLEILESMGIDQVGVLPFATIQRLSPDEFVRRVVVEAFNARIATVGHGFRYGAGRTGDVASLREAGEVYGFLFEALKLVQREEGPISSSEIRRCIAAGDVETATGLLGRHHELRGAVSKRDPEESWPGIPTAILDIDPWMAVPGRGVYAVWAVIGAETHPALCQVAARSPNTADAMLGVHVLDWSGDLDGREIGVLFVERFSEQRSRADADQPASRFERYVARARLVLG